ncbi:MAG: CatA-like O-acetyltransferase [Victivallaceae bacterium]|nr:CatA-like O-acetyltransferase [Victivallaceae bacterium]
MNSFRKIDLSVWPRAPHCAVFRKMMIPTYTVGFELEISNFQRQIRAGNLSFTLAMIHLVSSCANEIENFRYRFLNGGVVLYDRCSVNFVWLNKETELFKFVAYPSMETLPAFVAGAKAAAEAQTEYFVAPPANDAFVFSPLPWVSYTEKSHTYSGNAEQASPIFDWGKFFVRGDELILPFSVQVHHSFVDGIHIGKLHDALQRELKKRD